MATELSPDAGSALKPISAHAATLAADAASVAAHGHMYDVVSMIEVVTDTAPVPFVTTSSVDMTRQAGDR